MKLLKEIIGRTTDATNTIETIIREILEIIAAIIAKVTDGNGIALHVADLDREVPVDDVHVAPVRPIADLLVLHPLPITTVLRLGAVCLFTI